MTSYAKVDYLCSSKSGRGASGDHVHIIRNIKETLVICVDGVGTGIKADIAANITISRVKHLFNSGKGLREIFNSLADSMQRWREHIYPFCAFLLARVSSDGRITVMNYEYPDPVFFNDGRYFEPDSNILRKGTCIARESFYSLNENDIVFIMSDGITQAGMGKLPMGLTRNGAVRKLTEFIGESRTPGDICRRLFDFSEELDSGNKDDKTIAALEIRPANVVNLLTGPPLDKQDDRDFIKAFFDLDGYKIVSGATTAEICARVLGENLEMSNDKATMFTPPKYSIEGVDLVTEGALTISQAYNLIDAGPPFDDSPSSEIAGRLLSADIIRLWYGKSMNTAYEDPVFTKTGVSPRIRLIPRLQKLLESRDKIVDVHSV